jgi:hypothetical protein
MGNSAYSQSKKEGATYKCHNTGGIEFEKARKRSLTQFHSESSNSPHTNAESQENDSVHEGEIGDLSSKTSLR